MPAARSLVGCLLALFPMFAACGGSGDTPAAPVPGEVAPAPSTPSASSSAASGLDFTSASAHIARLIPANTTVLVQLQSFERFDAMLSRLARAHDQFGRQLDELGRALHRGIPGDERQVLPNQPLAIALTFPNDGEPEVTFVLPVKDVVTYKRSLQIAPLRPQPVYDGYYLAVTMGSRYERSRDPVALAADMPEHALTVRIDLARLDQRYGLEVRALLASLGDQAPGDASISSPESLGLAALAQLGEPLVFALAAGRQAELCLDVGSDRLQVRCAFETREAGVLGAWTAGPPIDLAPFARSLVASDSIALLGGCDPVVLVERVAPLFTSTPEERDQWTRALESFATRFGGVAGFSGSLSHGESHFALHVRADDGSEGAQSLASEFELFARQALGLVVQSKSTIEQEGVEVHDLVVRMDAASTCLLSGEVAPDLALVQARLDALSEKLFGASTVRVRVARFGDHGLIGIGNDEVWFRRTLLWAKHGRDMTPPDMTAAIEHLGEIRAAAILRFDLARWAQDREHWARQWRSLFEPDREAGSQVDATVQAVDPRSLTIYLGAEGRTLRVGCSMALASEPTPDMARR